MITPKITGTNVIMTAQKMCFAEMEADCFISLFSSIEYGNLYHLSPETNKLFIHEN